MVVVVVGVVVGIISTFCALFFLSVMALIPEDGIELVCMHSCLDRRPFGPQRNVRWASNG